VKEFIPAIVYPSVTNFGDEGWFRQCVGNSEMRGLGYVGPGAPQKNTCVRRTECMHIKDLFVITDGLLSARCHFEPQETRQSVQFRESSRSSHGGMRPRVNVEHLLCCNS
jgi:hypothetical protein